MEGEFLETSWGAITSAWQTCSPKGSKSSRLKSGGFLKRINFDVHLQAAFIAAEQHFDIANANFVWRKGYFGCVGEKDVQAFIRRTNWLVRSNNHLLTGEAFLNSLLKG